MINTEFDIECAIEKILSAGGCEKNSTVPQKPKRRCGRPARNNIPVWALSFYHPTNNRTFALISMCIKEDFGQSLEELAARLAGEKSRSPKECLCILRRLKKFSLLGYYGSNYSFHVWNGEEQGYGLETLRN